MSETRERDSAIAIAVFVEWGRRSSEESFGVGGHILMLSCTFDRSVKGPGDESAPHQDTETEESENGTDSNEDRAFGEVACLHVWCVGGWWYRRSNN
jgi:hypothetical protein